MSYTPNNIQIFNAAFTGALAGMGASDRVPTSVDPLDYEGLAIVAGAFAQAFDTQWGATAVNGLNLAATEQLCEVAWQDRSPNNTEPFNNPANHIPLCNALIAMILAGGVYYLAQGITPPSVPGGGGNFAFPNRVDLSVNKARVDNAQFDKPVLTTQTGSNLAGAFNGGGLGNKGILGINGLAGMPIQQFAAFEFEWENLTPDVPSLLFYSNFIFEITPGVYKIFVLDIDGLVQSPMVITPLGGNKYKATWNATRYVKVVNFIPPVVPAVQLAPTWPATYYLLSDIIAAYPNAKLVDVSTLDGGMPNTTITPSVMLLLGDSNNVKAYSKAINSIKLNGNSI